MYEGRIVAEHTPDVSEAGAGRRDDGRPEHRRGAASAIRAMAAGQGAARGARSRSATTILAFLIGGLVVAATGHNPIAAYKAIFDGSGLN